jgi:hypothetical protein
MSKTKKNRKGPAESATIFPVGTTKRGNDGNAWKIIKTDSGVHRWAKIGSNRTVKNKSEIKEGTENNITLSRLKQLGQKNNVLTSGKSKSGIAQLLFNICGSALSTDDLQEIHTLLPSKSKKEALRMIETQLKNPISNYKGMWKRYIICANSEMRGRKIWVETKIYPMNDLPKRQINLYEIIWNTITAKPRKIKPQTGFGMILDNYLHIM